MTDIIINSMRKLLRMEYDIIFLSRIVFSGSKDSTIILLNAFIVVWPVIPEYKCLLNFVIYVSLYQFHGVIGMDIWRKFIAYFHHDDNGV